MIFINILWLFLIKQLLHSLLLDMDDYSQLSATCLVGSPTHTHGIIVKYMDLAKPKSGALLVHFYWPSFYFNLGENTVVKLTL